MQIQKSSTSGSYAMDASHHPVAHQVLATVSLEDPDLLWISAARALDGYETLTADEIAELIGPREDPDLEACIVTLMTSPGHLPGCTSEDVITVPSALSGTIDTEPPSGMSPAAIMTLRGDLCSWADQPLESAMRRPLASANDNHPHRMSSNS
ncbi:hypothetical protein [Iodidimonas sp. SYSU 1G8]|uniref:hypothetical protein n=1 Tax=Iodidimonas sp. SYSU 1G8 TaxID=3133967 RepID=UPI0031FE7216